MIRLKSVSGAGFRSFAKKFEIKDLPDTGLVSLSGKSGAGKSSFTQAIGYVLGTMEDSVKEQVCWLPEAETMKVKLTLGKNDEITELVRGLNTAHLDNERGRAEGAKALNAALPEFFGMDLETLALVSYRPQGKKGSFLSKDDAQKKSMLWTLLGLAQYETGAEKLKNDQLAAKRESDTLEATPCKGPGEAPISPTSVFTVGDTIFAVSEDTEPAFLAFLEEGRKNMPDAPPEAQQVENLQREMADIAAAAAKLEAEFESECRNEIANGSVELRSSREEMLKAKESFVVVGKEFSEAKAALDRSNSVLVNLQRDASYAIEQEERLILTIKNCNEQLEVLRSGNCPTCKQPWEDIRTQDRLHRELATAESGLKTVLIKKEELVTFAPKAQAQHQDAEVQFATIKGKHEHASKALNDAQEINRSMESAERERQTSLRRDKFDPLIQNVRLIKQQQQATVQNSLERAQSARQNWIQLTQGIEATIKQTKLEYKIVRDAWKHYEQLVSIWNQQNEALIAHQRRCQESKEKAELLSDSRDILQGFLDRVVQDVLAEINVAADNLIGLVPNVSRMGLVLGVREKRGRAEIAAQISVDGQIVEYTQLSGGQQSVVALLTDLAIWEVVARYRAGAMPGWLVLDEPFDGMGPADVDSCLDILERYAQERLILVIHHATEFKQRFSKTYDFVWNVTGSAVELAT